MATGTIREQTRKLTGQIAEQDVFAREMRNADLDEADEAQDEYDELVRQRTDLAAKIEACEDADERRDLRAQARELSRQIRTLDSRILGLYIEASGGTRFTQEELEAAPVRTQTTLMRQAAKFIFGDSEDPTDGRTAKAASG